MVVCYARGCTEPSKSAIRIDPFGTFYFCDEHVDSATVLCGPYTERLCEIGLTLRSDLRSALRSVRHHGEGV